MLLDAIQVFPAKRSVLSLHNVGQGIEMLKHQVSFPPGLFGVNALCPA